LAGVGVEHADLAVGVSGVAGFLEIGAVVDCAGDDEEYESEEDADDEAADVGEFALVFWMGLLLHGRGRSLLSLMSHWCKLGARCADCYIDFQNMIYCKIYKINAML